MIYTRQFLNVIYLVIVKKRVLQTIVGLWGCSHLYSFDTNDLDTHIRTSSLSSSSYGYKFLWVDPHQGFWSYCFLINCLYINILINSHNYIIFSFCKYPIVLFSVRTNQSQRYPQGNALLQKHRSFKRVTHTVDWNMLVLYPKMICRIIGIKKIANL